MARVSWLADVLRADGLKVIELDGWQGRGRSDFDPQAVICHHTATGPGWSDESVVRLLRDGRSDLPGPLAQLGLRRDGTFDVIAAGRANHNGYGKYGNDSIGIEAYNDGQGERWPDAQLDAFERGSAAILRHLDLPVSRCIGHKESDPNRKIDPRDVDMNAFRSKVARHVVAGPQEDDDMTTPAEVRTIVADELDKDRQWQREELKRNTQALTAEVRAQVAAALEAISQLGNGGSVDYKRVQDAAEAAVRKVLGSVAE